MSAWDKIKDVVGSVAPMAGSMLAGPAGGLWVRLDCSSYGVGSVVYAERTGKQV